jgi:hypothetical protein
MENPFGTASGREQTEQTARPDIPLGEWFIARTSDRGNAKPYIKDTRDGRPFIFKTGLFCVGGDGVKVVERMYGGYAFFQAFIHPNYKDQGGPQSQDDYDALSGRLTGFINAVLAAGIEDKNERWAASMSILASYASELAETTDPDKRVTGEMFDVTHDDGQEFRDNGAYMAEVFASLLREAPRLVIINQKIDKGRDGDRNDVVVGSFKDAISSNLKTKTGTLQLFPDREGNKYELYDEATTGGDEDNSNF